MDATDGGANDASSDAVKDEKLVKDDDEDDVAARKEKEEKKRKANERRAKIMAQMASMQRAFIAGKQ